jgi:hypothetical protein
MQSAALTQLEALVEAIQSDLLGLEERRGFAQELLGYLQLEMTRFAKYAELFEDPETRQGFERVQCDLERFQALCLELDQAEEFQSEDWEEFLRDARAVNASLHQNTQFLLT